MFRMRSLFARMLITISLVLTVSFLILSAVLANYSNQYEVEKRAAQLERTAVAAAELLEERFGIPSDGGIAAIIARDPEACRTFFRVYLSNTEETVLLLCDSLGRVLLAEDGSEMPPAHLDKHLPDDLLAGLTSERALHGYYDLFEERGRLTAACPLYATDGDAVGSVVVYSLTDNYGGMTRVVLRTVLLSSLWIILGAIVILYLFCERVAGPLHEMGIITKRFAKGRFDRRVTVVGDDEIATLGLAFNQMADSLEQLETMRNSFISNVSHDLRTPMTTILGFIEGINSGAIPEEKHAYYLDVIAGEVRRLSRLVTELLDLSRLQSGTRKFNFTTFDICEMARLILISNEQRIEEKHLDVNFAVSSDSISVIGDKDAIHQVLYNLCDNAIKFSAEGGTFSLTIAPSGKRKVFVTVYNEGEGIPDADVPFVFDRFYKSDKSRSRDKTGAGLGLYISKTIMEAHGEELTLKSVEGESCAFTLTLPLAGE